MLEKNAYPRARTDFSLGKSTSKAEKEEKGTDDKWAVLIPIKTQLNICNFFLEGCDWKHQGLSCWQLYSTVNWSSSQWHTALLVAQAISPSIQHVHNLVYIPKEG